MSEENKALVRREMEATNERNDALIDELVAPEFIAHVAGMPDADRATWKKNVAMFFTAFPDLHYGPDDMVAEGDKVVVRTTFRGTHKGEFLGIPPSGHSVEFQGMFIFRVAGGKLVEEWGNIDVMGLMQQIGAIPTG